MRSRKWEVDSGKEEMRSALAEAVKEVSRRCHPEDMRGGARRCARSLTSVMVATAAMKLASSKSAVEPETVRWGV